VFVCPLAQKLLAAHVCHHRLGAAAGKDFTLPFPPCTSNYILGVHGVERSIAWSAFVVYVLQDASALPDLILRPSLPSYRPHTAARPTSVSSTACRSKVERLMTLSTSAVAVCCCSDSRNSLSSRCVQAPSARPRSGSRPPPREPSSRNWLRKCASHFPGYLAQPAAARALQAATLPCRRAE
jgi:hypothetical protein